MAGFDVTTTGDVRAAPAGQLRRWSLVWNQRPRLLKIARRRTSGEHDAEDVVAEALLRAMEHPEIDEERLPAWLTTVTVRLCADAKRERVREERLWSRTGPPAPAASFEERVCDLSEAAWVSRRLAGLPARQAQALRLRADGHDVAGVARILGVNYRTAESLLARGRAAARSWLIWSLAALAALITRWGRWREIRVAGAGRTVAISAGMAAVGVAVVTHAVLPHAARPARPGPVRTGPPAAPAATNPPAQGAPGPPHPGAAAATVGPRATSPAVSPSATPSAGSGPAGTGLPSAAVPAANGNPAAGMNAPAAPSVPQAPVTAPSAPPRLPSPQLPGSGHQPAGLPGQAAPRASAP